MSLSSILFSCLSREVACFDLDAFAENRDTKCFKSLIFSSFLALSERILSWIAVAAIIKSS